MTINTQSATSLSAWRPLVGAETRLLFDRLRLPDSSQQSLTTETLQILGKCGSPEKKSNADIGLVFGCIQSGKTMSFTALTAMAKDNGFRLIVIIAGISTNLVEQSYTRLEKDLGIDSDNSWQWLSFRNPKLNDSTTRSQINYALNDWNDPTCPPEERRTVLITVMKQKNHLANLMALLKSIDLKGVPTLIIDDEGDQHSLNAKARKNKKDGTSVTTPIHQHIVDLKNGIPHHTFLQYTATPQAPLFIDLMDSLSPNFIQLLTPGPKYTGGTSFFREHSSLVQVISDITRDEDLSTPPASLVYALQVYFLGAAKGKMSRDGKCRSMMIHPSKLTFTHNDYHRFVISIKNHFVDLLSLPESDPDRKDLLGEFRTAYDDLQNTCNDLPPFDELVDNRLKRIIASTVVQSLNSKRGNNTNVQWRNSYSWILIGGQAMDRGFTVEGLTVTYMPRSIGIGNADTIQQRARFFGYKADYLGYCRVYLDSAARDMYIDYIEHEEDMRRRLSEYQNTSGGLNEWYREVFLPGSMKLARTSVFSRDFERSIFGGNWSTIKKPQQSDRINDENRTTLVRFEKEQNFDLSGRYPRLSAPLSTIYDELLNSLRFTNDCDAADYASLLYVLDGYLSEEPEIRATVYLMSSWNNPRTRSLGDNEQIKQLFQGRNEKSSGLREVKGDGITFQIYVLDLEKPNGTVIDKVVGLATFVPEAIGKELIRWAP